MIFDILIGWLNKLCPMKNKLTYEEIIDYKHNCGIKHAGEYKYKDVLYQVCDISLQAGVDEVSWQVIYYPLDNILVRFSRDLGDFKTKFEEIEK